MIRILRINSLPAAVSDVAPSATTRTGGFTMIELTIVLAVLSVVLAGVLPFIASDNQQSALETTAERQEAIHAAIASYAAANNNRLPCPSDIIDALDDVNFGRAGPPGACVAGDPVADPSATDDNGGDVVYGGVPVKDIGLSDEYAFDGFGQRFSYHVFEPLTVDGALTGGAAGPYISVFDDDATLEGGGIPREDAAVYVLLSHGQQGHGAFLRNGAAQKDLNTTSDDELENADYDNVLGDSAYDGLFVQAPSRITDNAANYFDDIVGYKTLNQVAGAAATAGGASAVTWLADGENIYPAGSDGLFSGASERVGIGTDSPTEFLHVSGGDAQFDSNAQIDGRLGVGTPGTGANEAFSVSNVAGEGVRIGPNANDGSIGLLVTSNATTQRSLIARAATGQTADILRVEDSAANSLLTVDNDGYVGIGTDSPSGLLTLVADSPGSAGADNVKLISYGDQWPFFIINRARGTAAAPTAVQAGDRLGSFEFSGHTGSNFVPAAQINTFSEQDWTPTASTQDGYMQFRVARDGTLSEAMRITSDGRVGINNTAPDAELRVDGDIHFTGVFADVSDARYKEHIAPLNPAEMLERVTQIRNVRFTMKDDPEERTEFGVIAQELEPIFPELVNTSDDAHGTKTVAYSGLIAPMIAAIQQQQRQIEALQEALSNVPGEMKDTQAEASAVLPGWLSPLGGGLALIVLLQGAALAVLWRRVMPRSKDRKGRTVPGMMHSTTTTR